MARTLAALPGQTADDGAHDLVLLGDTLDLSLGQPATAAQVFGGWLSCLPRQMLGGRITFVPGNHDHALWTAQRHAHAAGDPTDPARWAHVTPAFADRASLGGSAMLNALMPPGAGPALTLYPNLGLGPVTVQGEHRAVMLHHGHFIEAAYKLMTGLLTALSGQPAPPMTAASLETVNGSWIDFAWSTLGDTGPLGRQVALAEGMLVTGGGAHAIQDRMAAVLARMLKSSLPLPHEARLTDTMLDLSRGLVDSFAGAYSEQERFSYTDYLSRASQAGLLDYLDHVVAGQMARELGGDPSQTRLSFIFGHTHKPFADQVIADAFARPVPVYNTGGWVLDTALLSSVEGAAVAFVDAQMNTALLTAYGLDGDGVVQKAAVSSADPVADADNPMLQALGNAVAQADPEWGAFRDAVSGDLDAKQQMYLHRAAQQGTGQTGRTGQTGGAA